MSPPSNVTTLLERWRGGDKKALDRLVPIVYDELRRRAHQRLRSERGGHTLNTTALVHEAYVKLVELDDPNFSNRAHFLSMASRVMRRVLIDYARMKKAAKRGGGAETEPLEEALLVPDEWAESLLELHDALERLEDAEPRAARVVEQRYFGGLTLEETAEALDVSLATVGRDLRFAQAWLARALGEGWEGPEGGPAGDPEAEADT